MRVASWNLWGCLGDWTKRRAAIEAVLAELDADILGLQEVWGTARDSFAGRLARRLGMHHCWCPSPVVPRWRRARPNAPPMVGNAVLSRWPIRERAHLDLPRAGQADEGRRALYCGVGAPGATIPVFTTQLNSRPDHSAVRYEQVLALAGFVAAHCSDAFPAVVTGDLNAEEDSDEIRRLCGHKTAPAAPGLVLVDAWRYADPRTRGYTWDTRNPHAESVFAPDARIDYVLVGLPRPSGAGRVLAAWRFGARPVDAVWPSDHAGVAAALQLP